MRKAALVLMVGCIGLLFTASTHSSERYGYWGVDLLGTKMVEDDGVFADDLDDTSADLRLYTGYRANRWTGIEGAIQGLGRYYSDDNRFDYSALTLSGMLYLPVTRSFEFYVRAGTGVGWIRDRERRDTNSKPLATAGIGAQAHITPLMTVRGGIDGYGVRPRIADADGNARTADQRIAVGYLGVSVLF